MPAEQRGWAYRLKSGKWAVRWRDTTGRRLTKSGFQSKSAALRHYRHQVAPQLRGETPALPDLTLSEFVELFLERHAVNVRSRTIATLRERPRHAERDLGDIRLRELERMADQVAAWAARQPERVRHHRLGALRQALDAAVRWDRMGRNPAKTAGRNPKPTPRAVRVFTDAELEAIALELPAAYAPLPAFAAATGLRPEEWIALHRRDIDRRARVLHVAWTMSGGELVALGKTARSRRQVPLSQRAIDALDATTPRLDSPLLFPAPRGGIVNIDNFRRRVWAPAVDAGGIATPARIYDLRSTFASRALHAGVPVFEVAKVMGTSVAMIERHYGALLDGAGPGIAARLDALDAPRRDRATAGRADDR